jgi:pyruvate dehydrogenase E2 component (dihydrolipoamide acetyltransferase)
MKREIKIPEIGENIESGEVVKILVSVGDVVETDQPVIELETDKAVVEIPSPVAGKIEEINVSEGDSIVVGQVIAIIETEAEPGTVRAEEKRPEEEIGKEAAAATDATVPEIRIEEDAARVTELRGTEEAISEISSRPIPGGVAAPAAPSVRRLARELGVDINRVSGTGPVGRITRDDVKNFVKRHVASLTEMAVSPAISTKPLPDFTRWGEVERESLSRVRRVIAENTGYAWNTIPHVTQFDEADITELEDIRKGYNRSTKEPAVKITVTAVLLKVIATALKRFPRFNASIDMSNDHIIYKKYYHIGVAVDTDRGLLVPVIRNVDGKSIRDLAVELESLAEKTRSRKASLEELEGGTFTISNQGGIGGTAFTPIVFWPQVAILGVSRASVRPVHVREQFEPRLILPLSLSYDHRVIDGADAARFLSWVTEALRHPLILQIE